MEDGEGRVIDFKNTIILLTSNTGSDLISSLSADPDTIPSERNAHRITAGTAESVPGRVPRTTECGAVLPVTG